MRLLEGDLEFDFEDALSAVKFDDGSLHSFSSLQPVDFIVEYEDCFRFIEIKDPDEPGAADIEAFREKLKSGRIVRSLAGKFRDTFFFRHCQGELDKEVEFVVLLSMEALDDALLLAKQDELRRSIPVRHALWRRDSARACVVLNLKQWRRRFGETSVRRLSETNRT